MSADLIIDTIGSRCPIPLLRAKQGLKKLQPGQMLKVLSSDPSSVDDFEAMLKHLPHRLCGVEKAALDDVTVYTFLIQKG